MRQANNWSHPTWYVKITSSMQGNNMTPPLLTRLSAMFCRHQFSWPHTGARGQDYQVCLVCGAAYGFDCTTMRRTGRLAGTDGGRSAPSSNNLSVDGKTAD
jgi:hypothetical protein